ncbi:MAG: hypothetical protein H6623_08215 [Bdellovibrionaceae bacterium]|nr:hypothetical protein [Pseudobdellovibrionaceae bacterium]
MFFPLRNLPSPAPYKKGDVVVLFGELFTRGYANGIVDEAQKHGLTIVRSTVGRREGGELRALTEVERADIPLPFINIPLEAGFDMEPDDKGQTPCDALKGYKMDEWDKIRLDWDSMEQARRNGEKRFRANTKKYMEELSKHIPEGANVLFVHTMAGGVPRAKILMPVMNKVFKGRGDRFISSQDFWESDLGRLCDVSFKEVTAYTFKHLVELSNPLRTKIEKNGGHVSYVAYGYHGTEVLHGETLKWQTYAPYVQGWAKLELEKLCEKYFSEGLHTAVFNCPEILTNSSSIFQGVEVPLYPFMGSLKKQNSRYTDKVLNEALALLKPEHNLQEIMNITKSFFEDPVIQAHMIYDKFPQHNSKEQMEKLLTASETIINMHKDPKNLATFVLSEEIFKSTGTIMFNESWKPSKPVIWLGHDILAKQLSKY